MTCFPSCQRVASIAVGSWGKRKSRKHLTDDTYKGRLTVLRLEEGLARPFPGGLPLRMIPGTESVSMILNLSVLVPPPPLAVEERTDFPGYLFFPNESYARH